jgi:hypothetical protein
LEEKWKRRTYIWTILSALLAAGVALTVPLISSSGSAGRSLDIATGPIENCLSSLKRLETLSVLQDQTVTNLSNAIRLHGEQCEGVLDAILAELAP